MSKLIIKGHILVPDADLAAVLEELQVHRALTRQEEGCLVFNVTQDEENLNRLNVYEEYADRSAFGTHQKRARASRWWEVSANAIREYDIITED